MSKTLVETLNSHPELSAGHAVKNQFHCNESDMMRRRILALRGDSAALSLMDAHNYRQRINRAIDAIAYVTTIPNRKDVNHG